MKKSVLRFAGRILILVLALIGLGGCTSSEPISFNRDIRPILNSKCVSCHGGVKKAGALGLLFRSEALQGGESGKPAIIPGNPSDSELIRRIRHGDPQQRMPREAEPLAPVEISLLESWIERGAEWEDHWAYLVPTAVDPPVASGEWTRNEIDRFILAKLTELGLSPSPDADRSSLIRRVSLDLTGLPPTPEEADQFLTDKSPNAYERVVDRLLASPRYGERWAGMWLDLARYADTKGYERDPGREIWLYRDWLIQAFKRDLPFDQFTIEQLAGDMLPHPTRDQYTATAFHRNTMNNDEGGTENEEYRVAAVIDRVNTTWEVWMGTTFACVQCHGHPFDPFRHEEYYRAYAYLNNTRDEDTPEDAPVLKMFSEAETQRIERIKQWVASHSPGQTAEVQEAIRRIDDLIHFAEPKVHPHYFEILRNGTHADTKYLEMYRDGSAVVRGINLSGKPKLLTRINWAKNGSRMRITLDKPDGRQIADILLRSSQKGHWIFALEEVSGTHDLYFHFDNPNLEPQTGTSSFLWFLFWEGLPGEGSPGYEEILAEFIDLRNTSTETVPILVENVSDFARPTHIFERGNWLVQGAAVDPGLPDSLLPESAPPPRNRLEFARWMVSPANPLTARVAVNRFWEQLFGLGLVETLEDFGTQGSAPSHPELLDWLAVKFSTDYAWSVKTLLRSIVLSSTYRQSSRVAESILEKDPENRYLSRGPRVRLSAEQIRDQALAVGGLLSTKMFGPSVMPPQPEGVWQVIYSDEKWETSSGEDRYRRALYTYWRRTSPYPSMLVFDSPSREFCVARRIPTNTPLQALVTLNDPVYVEAAQALAMRMFDEGGDTLQGRIIRGVKLALAREPDEEMLSVLIRLFKESSNHYINSPDEARKIVTKVEDGKTPDLAALTVVANTLMNLDEFLSK